MQQSKDEKPSNITTKSILKSSDELNAPSTSPSLKRRLKWDEENIEITGQDRGTRQKISEPKTPYIHYDANTDKILLGSAYLVPPMDLMKGLEQYPIEKLEKELKKQQLSEEWLTTDEEHEEEEESEEFLRKRQEHYNMKEALLKAKQLLEKEEEIDDEELEHNTDYNTTEYNNSNSDYESKYSETEEEEEEEEGGIRDDESMKSSSIRLYMKTPSKPSLLNSSNSSIHSKSGKEKHVRIVDSRTKTV